MNSSVITNLLQALLKWWWLIIVAVSLGVGIGYLVRAEQQDLYYSKATIVIGLTDGPIPSNLDEQQVDSFTVLIRRNSVLQPVIDELELNISIEELQARLNIETEEDIVSPVIGIGVTDTDPERAAAIANRIAQEVVYQTTDRSTILDLEFATQQVEDIQNQISQLQANHARLVEEAEGLTSAFDLSQNVAERNQIDATIQELRNILVSLVENTPRSSVIVDEYAQPNFFPVATNQQRDLAIAGAAGGILAVLTIILFTFFDDRLQWNEGADDHIAGTNILGPLGIIARDNLPLYVDKAPQSVEAEALRQVRAKIALVAGGKQPKVITLTSYDSGEGKTLTSVNMALQLSQAGMRTLVIDGDMRRGDMHEMLRVPNVFGLSDLLMDSQPLDELLPQALLDSGYENLTFISAGRGEGDPASLLERPRFGRLIEMMRARYDVIVMDAAPVLGGPDAIFLARASDGVVVIANNRKTRMSSLERTLKELEQGPNVRIFGVIYNRVRLQITTKYNNKYYRSTPAMNPEKLTREMARPSRSGFPLRANIILDSKGNRLYSMTACATRLGVKKEIVREWLRTGYLKSERRAFRSWVSEESIAKLLEQRHTTLPEVDESLVKENGSPSTNGTHHLPDQLREQREAVLGFANHPDTPDSGQ